MNGKASGNANWQVNADRQATFKMPGSSWEVGYLTSDPTSGLCIRYGDRSAKSLAGPTALVFRLLPSGAQTFPPLDDYYVRGNDLICSYPQTESNLFGLEVCHRMMMLGDDCLGVETICSVQTSLLDSHPTFDVASQLPAVAGNLPESHGKHRAVEASNPVTLDLTPSTNVPPAITILSLANLLPSPADLRPMACLILPPSDRSVSSVLQRPEHGTPFEYTFRYRLLAEFLEKGVIRKARIWTVLWNSEPSPEQLSQCYQQLLAEPLPLTP